MQYEFISSTMSGKCKVKDKTMQSDEIAAIIGADSEKARERAYFEVWQNLRFIYGTEMFRDESFQDFCLWLDGVFEVKGGINDGQT